MFSFNKAWKVSKYVVWAIVFSIALSGCTILPKNKKTIDPNANKVIVWSFEDEDTWKPVAKSFASQNKGYSLVYQKQTLDGNYENRVLNSIMAGQGPDVWAMPNDWVYRHKEKLYPMPDNLAKTINLDNQFVPAIKQSVSFNNKIYALAPTAEPLMVYYNPKIFSDALDAYSQNNKDKEAVKRANDLLADVPQTWTNFTAAAKLLTKTNGSNIEISGVALGTSNITNAADIVYFLMTQNETDIITKDYNLATFNLPKNTATGNDDNPGERALTFYTSFANSGSGNYTWNDSLGNEIDAFINNKVAMIFGYSSLSNLLAQKYPNFKFKKTFVPEMNQDSKAIVDYARFTAFGVSRLSKNMEPAWNLVNNLSSDLDSTFSSSTKIYTSAKAQSYDISITNRTGNNPEELSLATAKSLTKGRYPAEFDKSIRAAIENVSGGDMNAKTALDLAASTITDLLRKSDW